MNDINTEIVFSWQKRITWRMANWVSAKLTPMLSKMMLVAIPGIFLLAMALTLLYLLRHYPH